MEILQLVNIYEKCHAVISSVNKVEHIESAKKYLTLYFKKFNDKESYDKLANQLAIIEDSLILSAQLKVFGIEEEKEKLFILNLNKMSLLKKVNDDFINALKNKDNAKRDILRMIKSGVDAKSRSEEFIGKEFTDADVLKIIAKLVADLKEINDDKAKIEISILSEYLPKELSESELTTIILKVIDTNKEQAEAFKAGNKSLMGFFMKECATAVNGGATNKQISEILKTNL